MMGPSKNELFPRLPQSLRAQILIPMYIGTAVLRAVAPCTVEKITIFRGALKYFSQLMGCVLLVMFFLGNLPVSATPESLDNAVRLYQDGSYQEALALFETLNSEVNSSGLFYNIGNCHVRLEQYGKAIGAYLSAMRRDKHNAALIHNVNYARGLAGSAGLSNPSGDSLKDVTINLIQHVSLRTHQYLFLILYSVWIAVLIYLGVYRRSFQGAHVWWLSILCLLCLEGLIITFLSAELHQKEGVVIEQKATARYGPSSQDTEAFVLPVGTLFSIHRIEKDWMQIQLTDGKVGWLAKESLTILS